MGGETETVNVIKRRIVMIVNIMILLDMAVIVMVLFQLLLFISMIMIVRIIDTAI